jgi:hypothetical protein
MAAIDGFVALKTDATDDDFWEASLAVADATRQRTYPGTSQSFGKAAGGTAKRRDHRLARWRRSPGLNNPGLAPWLLGLSAEAPNIPGRSSVYFPEAPQ